MEVIYALIPMMLIFGFLVVVVFIWMAKSGQFDDMDGAANRIFMDDEYPEDLAPKKSDVRSNESQEGADNIQVDESKAKDAKGE